jgi:hypothetical protein
MNTSDKCKNCGGEQGIHHYRTNQCPVGGREAPIGRKQEYMTTTFEPDRSDELEELREKVRKLIARVEALEGQVERLQSVSELEESVRIYGAG